MADNFPKEFPVLSQYVYANIAASGLMYDQLVDWRQEHDLDFLIKGSLFRDEHHLFLEEIRNTVGRFFNCRPANVSLVPNFSFGFNTVLEGIGEKKKVLLLKNDYPSVNLAVEGRDFETCYVDIDENLEQNIEEAVKREQPHVLALSLVQYINGIKIDLDFIKALKTKYPDLMIIADGTQFCGTQAFDFENSGIDVLGASAYKWLLAGYGNGFMLFNQNSIGKIYADAFQKTEQNGDFSKEQQHLMRFFEPGHLDTLNFGSLKFSLEFLEEIGIERIQARIRELSDKASQAFSELGLLEDRVIRRKEHSSIFNIKGDDRLFKHLRSQNIICSQRGNGIRLSFHFFNSEKDISKICLALRS